MSAAPAEHAPSVYDVVEYTPPVQPYFADVLTPFESERAVQTPNFTGDFHEETVSIVPLQPGEVK